MQIPLESRTRMNRILTSILICEVTFLFIEACFLQERPGDVK
jgi:hypothetical protein